MQIALYGFNLSLFWEIISTITFKRNYHRALDLCVRSVHAYVKAIENANIVSSWSLTTFL